LNALVVRERTQLDDIVTVPKVAEDITDGDVGLRAGQRFTVRQLLKMMLIASANDAATTLAVHVGGSERRFVGMMNDKARSLGLRNTQAACASGLSERETSTAADLTVIARKVMADSVMRGIVQERSVYVARPGASPKKFKATNELLGVYAGMQGVKTGYTSEAGFCLVGSAKRGDIELLGAVMGAGSNAGRFSQMRRLLDWGFAHTRRRQVVSDGRETGSVRLVGGAKERVALKTAGSFSAIEFDGNPYTTRVVVPLAVRAPIAAGKSAGRIDIFQSGKVVKRVPLVAAETVKRGKAVTGLRATATIAKPPVGGVLGWVQNASRSVVRAVSLDAAWL